MKKNMIIALGAALALSGCVGDYYGPGPGPGAPIMYDAYYDGGYGAFYDGYWGPGDTFYYSRGPGRRYVRDRGGHFFHDRPAGRPGNFNQVHGPGNFRGGPGFHGRGGGGHHH